ncbi:hypothetical protein MSPP1_002601 [Malassezia sp. CBS 17886]|nr:hypothetical protein MSPP1_002601 [Malassezia sp. CBS 17886]
MDTWDTAREARGRDGPEAWKHGSAVEGTAQRGYSTTPMAEDSVSTAHTRTSSHSDSTDYERRYRVLKRMMPPRLARKCIDDLRAMRHGKGYHSDGRTSSDDADGARPARLPAAPQSSPHVLQPGESRRRMAHLHDGARPALLSDSGADSGHVSTAAVPSVYTISGVPDRVLGLPTRRGDVAPVSRLPLPHTARAVRVNLGDPDVLAPRRPRGAPHASERRIGTRASPPPPPAAAPRGPLPETWRNAVLATGELRTDYEELLRWDTRDNLQLDFGIAPPPVGTRFAADTDIARGRLHALLHGACTTTEPLFVFGRRLDMRMAPEDVVAHLHAVCDACWDSTYAAMRVRSVCDALHYIGDWVSWQLALGAGTGAEFGGGAALPAADADLDGGVVGHAGALDMEGVCASLLDTAQALLDRLAAEPPGSDARALMHAVLYFRVQVLWRMRTADGAPRAVRDVALLAGAQPLMLALLGDGVHRSVAALADGAHADSGGVRDGGAALWVALIHILCAVDERAFWDVLDAALEDWHGARGGVDAVVWSECVWYVLFAVCALSHMGAAAGTAGHVPRLAPHWGAVQRALRVKLRLDARVEQIAPRVLLRQRDAYVHIVLRRCLLLADRWQWSFLGAEPALARLFDIFDSHRLADLPTETDHDFAPFLRRFDVRLLLDGRPRGSAYHVFLQVLGRAGAELAGGGRGGKGDSGESGGGLRGAEGGGGGSGAGAGNDDGAGAGTGGPGNQVAAASRTPPERALLHLLSRMSPVRVMPFTRAQKPTSAERAMLFNHYSIVMLFLYLVPASAAQRLRQLRSFLPFARADATSQVTCIRAMVYAGTIVRHHALDLAPVTAWFADVVQTLARDHAECAAASGARVVGRETYAERLALYAHAEAAHMLVVAVRSVQHLVAHAALRPEVALTYPPLALLHRAWTTDLLDACGDASVVAEVLQFVGAFLRARARAVGGGAVGGGAVDGFSSGDDLDEMDDEMDALLADPGLAAALGEVGDAAVADGATAPPRVGPPPHPVSPPPPSASFPADVDLAHRLHNSISPALYRLLARRTQAGAGANNVPLDALVDCWAACASLLVHAGVRDWQGYLTLGGESWRRLQDPVLKRYVALRFVLQMATHDRAAYRVHWMDIAAIWFQTVAAYRVSEQAVLTRLLARPADRSLALWTHAARRVTRADAAQFEAVRPALLDDVLCAMDAAVSADASCAGFLIQSLSALLSSVRVYITEASGEPRGEERGEERGDARYALFARALLERLRGVGPLLARGIRTELDATMVALGG